MSINQGVLPDDWKNARVTPVYKEGVKSTASNYRPISVLPVVAKILERAVFNHFYAYLVNNDLLNKHQSGFRPLHSTVTALLDITNEWFINIDNGLINTVLFLDLKKAFDTIDHSILISKMKLYGMLPKTLTWFSDYLSQRTQKTMVNGILSDSKTIKCGIPQGSILGPLLFLLYINDLPNANLVSNVRMYADDTSLTYAASDSDELIQTINRDLANVHDWLNANKLSLNITKTKCMFLGTRQKLDQIPEDPNICINGTAIKRVKSFKCLGVYVDEFLTWESHIENISKKVAKGLGVFRRLRSFVPKSILITIYNSLIVPHLDYCSSVWGSIGKGLSNKIQKLQNRAARIITHSSYDIRSKDILNYLGWKNMAERRQDQLATLMFKTMNGYAPVYMSSMFTKTTDVHTHGLRRTQNGLFIPRPNSEAMKRGISYRGALRWNNLTNDQRNASTIAQFKNQF